MASTGFRSEVQALRALAVALVVLFHLWPEKLTGGFVGVDVFFVISGYLITSHLLRELDATGRIRLGRFYARRVRRLLPAAFLVLFATALAIFFFVERGDWPGMFRDIWSAALYSVNWVLAATSVDYFAAEASASPVQHYWSLSVEEQFYIVWPLLMLLAWKYRQRRGVIVALGVVFVASLVYSIMGAQLFQQFAYFATPAHAWEFAAGAALGMVLARINVRDGWWLTATSWVGWLAIAGAAVVFDGDSPFPGWIALLPVCGTLLVIVSGMPGGAWSLSNVVSWKPVQFLGDISYSLYLWHWPTIVLTPYALARFSGRDYLLAHEKLLLLLVCIGLAFATKIFVEDPARTAQLLQRGRTTFIAAGVATAVIVGIAATPVVMLNVERQTQAAQLDAAASDLLSSPEDSCLGALAASHPPSCEDSHVVSDEAAITFLSEDDEFDWTARRAENDAYFKPSCDTVASGNEVCRYGAVGEGVSIAVVGDSHAGHLLPGILTAARANGWAVDVWRIAECTPAVATFSTDEPDSREECQSWRDAIFDDVATTDVDLVVTTSYSARYSGWMERRGVSTQPLEDGFIEGWKTWRDADINVMAVSDVPTWSMNIPRCISDSADDLNDPCTQQERFAIFPDPIMNAVDRADDPGIVGVDTTDVFCDGKTCHSVVGGLVVARDSTHLTASFAETLAPRFETEIFAALGR